MKGRKRRENRGGGKISGVVFFAVHDDNDKREEGRKAMRTMKIWKKEK